MSAWMYILRLKSGSLYIGCTADLERRYNKHLSGNACRATALDQPEKLAYSEFIADLTAARQREKQIKRWTKAKKEALISCDKDALRSLLKSRHAYYHKYCLKYNPERGEGSPTPRSQ